MLFRRHDWIPHAFEDVWPTLHRACSVGAVCITNANVAVAVTAWIGGDATTYGNLVEWNTAAVASMASLFASKPTFNADISKWNVASLSNMASMFNAFNPNLASWNVLRVNNGNFDVDILASSFTYMTPSGWRCNRAEGSGCALVAASDTSWGGGGSASGANYLSLQNSVTVGTAITQTLAMPVNQQLRITFSARYRPWGGLENSAGSLSIRLGSQEWSQILAASWTSYSYDASPPMSESADLTIQNTCALGGDCTAQIDNVEVQGSGPSCETPTFPYSQCQRQSLHTQAP